jgi:hypothetical protein
MRRMKTTMGMERRKSDLSFEDLDFLSHPFSAFSY